MKVALGFLRLQVAERVLDKVSGQISWDQPDPEIEIENEIERSPSSKKEDGLRDVFRQRNQYQWSEKLGFIGGPLPKRRGRKLIAFSWASSLIDGTLILATSALLLSAISMIVKATNPTWAVELAQIPADLFLGAFLVLMSWVYQVSLRVFLGHTLGEWTYDLRLGTPTDRLLMTFGFKVVLRSTLVIGTGFILFPFLSFIFGQDVLGKICGLKIFSLR